jgi:hypothetical protein
VSAAAIKPKLALTIGVTGHRLHRLEGIDLVALRATVDATLSDIAVAMEAEREKHSALFSHDSANPRLVSALADGADSIVSQSALAAGWRVDACLPFARDTYGKDFAVGEPHAEFVSLLSQMSAVFELDGDHSAQETRNAAYETVGRLVLEQSDVLLAVWDGDPGRGRGGTSRVVAEAVARHIPVIHVHSQGGAPTLLWTGLSDAESDLPSVESVARSDAKTALHAVIHTLIAPPDNAIDRRMLTRFYRGNVREATPALPYPLLLAVAGVRRLSRNDLRAPQADTSANELSVLLNHAADVTQRSSDALVRRYGVADAAASYFAQIFRSGFVANFGLAALAVVLALGGLLAPAFKLPIIVAELVVIILILTNTRAGNRFGWHECWMDNRHLAEQLRALALTSLLGDLSLRSHVPPMERDAAAIPGWVGWLARATAREVTLPNVHADSAYLERVQLAALTLIDDQLGYQRNNASRMHHLEHRLHVAGQVLFGATVVACAVWIVAKLSGIPLGAVGKVGLTEVVTFTTATLPAIGAAIYGIRMQGDFVGIAHRAHTTVARLERLKRAMMNEPTEYVRLNARLRSLADIMLADVAHWRTTYQARPLALPG